MRRISVALVIAIMLALGSHAHAQTPAAFRVLFGGADTSITRWDGSLKVVEAGQYRLEPWRFTDGDNIDGDLFHFSSRPAGFFNGSFMPRNGELPVANGFIIEATAVTDEILADVESGTHMMGDEFSTADLPTLKIKLRGTSNFAKVTIIRDGKFVYSSSPNTQEVEFSWRDNQPQKQKTSYYYVRGEQDDGEIVWVSPMWIKYTGN